jgi:hypothetical protein
MNKWQATFLGLKYLPRWTSPLAEICAVGHPAEA